MFSQLPTDRDACVATIDDYYLLMRDGRATVRAGQVQDARFKIIEDAR